MNNLIFLLLWISTIVRCANELGDIIVERNRTAWKKEIYIGYQTVLDSFDAFANAIDYTLEYRRQSLFDDHPCIPSPSKVTLHQQQTINLIDAYNQEQFRQHFKDGHFDGEFPQLLAMLQMESGVVVLSNMGVLYYIQHDGKDGYKISQKLELEMALNPPVFLIKSFLPNKFLIIVKYFVLEVLVNLRSPDHYFIELQQSKLQLNPNEILTVEYHLHYLYVGLTNQELRIYKGTELVQTIPNFQIIQLKFHSFNEKSYMLVLNDGGVSIYSVMYFNFSFKLELLHQFAKFGKSAHLMDVNSNSLMVAIAQDEHLTLIVLNNLDYHIDFERMDWFELNRYLIPGIARDIKLSDNYAIIIGSNGHYLLHHSIANKFYKALYDMLDPKTHNTLVIPNLRQSVLFYNSTTDIMYGLTKYSFFVANFTRHPIKITCFSNQKSQATSNPLILHFSLNSTNCPSKTDQFDDLSMCHFEQTYEVQFKYPIMGTNGLIYVFFIVLSVVIAFTMLVILTTKQHLQFKKEQAQYRTKIAQLQSEGYKIEEFVKKPQLDNDPYHGAYTGTTSPNPNSAQFVQIETTSRASTHRPLFQSSIPMSPS